MFPLLNTKVSSTRCCSGQTLALLISAAQRKAQKITGSQVPRRGLTQGGSRGQCLLQEYLFHFIMWVLNVRCIKNSKIRKADFPHLQWMCKSLHWRTVFLFIFLTVEQLQILPLSCRRNHRLTQSSGVHQRCSTWICQGLFCASPSIKCTFIFLEYRKQPN